MKRLIHLGIKTKEHKQELSNIYIISEPREIITVLKRVSVWLVLILHDKI
jgi:hypothetical protein